MVKIAIGSDHGGFELKEQIKKYFENQNVEIADLGTHSSESCDYPDIAQKLSEVVVGRQVDFGILICGTGIGISIAANRCKGIRAALLYSEEAARLAKQHNNANVVVFGGRTMSYDEVVARLKAFMEAEYEGGRHQRRIDKIEECGC